MERIGVIFMNHRPKSGEIYKHFKDKLYQIVTIAKHSETGEELVIYQALYGDYKCYARPLEMFVSEVDHEKYPNIKQKYRFERRIAEKQEDVCKEVKDIDTSSSSDTWKKADNEPILHEENGKITKSEKENVITIKVQDSSIRDVRNETETETKSSFVKDVVNRTDVQNSSLNRSMNRNTMQTSSFFKDNIKNMNTEEKMMAFFDTEDLEERYKILSELRDDITDTMIDNMAVVMDVVIEDGSLTKRYEDLKYAIQTKQRYEQNTRLR